MPKFRCTTFLPGACGLFLWPLLLHAQCRPDQRRVTVSDAIEMTHVAFPHAVDESAPNAAVRYSPDGRRFVLVVSRGDLNRNVVEYSLVVYRTRDALRSRKPESRVVLASSSNRAGITAVKWLADSRTLLFIGEKPGRIAQIYSYDVVTRKLIQRTQNRTAITSFDASDDGRVIVFEAEPQPRDIVDTPATRRVGFVVTTQSLTEILLAGNPNSEGMALSSSELYLLIGHNKPRRIMVEDEVRPIFALSVSPNGRYALVEAAVRHVPPAWLGYKDRLIHEFVAAGQNSTAVSSVERYLLLDTKSGAIAPLLDAPKAWQHDGFFWISGGESIVLSRAYLPLDGISEAERELRENQTFVVEVKLPSREVSKITSQPYSAKRWERGTQMLLLQKYGGNSARTEKAYRELGNTWTEIEPGIAELKSTGLVVTYEEDMNTPPRLWMTDSGTGVKTVLLDLNPQFAHLCFAKEEKIAWKASDGHEVEGGLYLPPEYEPGHRYPLVIQTHAFDPRRFWIDGPWSSAFAAQPLAGRGIAVLQIGGAKNGEDMAWRSTPMEAPRQMAVFEGAIDSLDKQGIIDREHVGIIGFSRTVYHVAYTLTHSKYRFAAATLADGFNGGYFEQLAFPTAASTESNAVNGGPPFGNTLSSWIERSPEFNMTDIRTPVRLEAYSVGSAVEEWEWFSLSNQRKLPVDFVLLPRAPHMLVKPWERMASQQGNVDWFDFWLNGEAPAGKEAASEYERWSRLRALQAEQSETK